MAGAATDRKPFRPMAMGNWKMHMTVAESAAAARQLIERLRDVRGLDILIAPSYTALKSVGDILKGTDLRLAAQNAHWEEKGAFTGEVSAVQLKEVGCRFILIGHSERRHVFGESNEIVNRKILGALKQDLGVLLCVGETLAQRRSGGTEAVVKEQLEKGLAGAPAVRSDRIVVAYEPVWAIGTGQVATPPQISAVHAIICQCLAGIRDADAADRNRILYGGSVTPENIADLAAIPNLDGVLVGGASLQMDRFAAIVKTIERVKLR